MTVYILTVTFYAITGYGVAITSTTLPVNFQSVVECTKAGNETKNSYTGGAVVDWACTEVSK